METKQASIFGRWTGNTPERDNAYYSYWGDVLQKNLVNGVLLGGGATGLYHLARKVNQKRQEANKKPDLDAVAEQPLNLSALSAGKLAFDLSSLKTPAISAGLGALIGSMQSDKNKKVRGAITGGLVGGGLGALASTDTAKALIGKAIPQRLPSLFGYDSDDKKYHSLSPSHSMFLNMASLGSSAAGIAGGGYIANKLLKEKKPEKDNVGGVERARQEYFDALLGDEKTSQALDELYEKRGAWKDYIPNIISDPNDYGEGNILYNTLWKGPASAYLTAAGLSALGGGVVGGKYMYDKTKSQSEAKILAQAEAARRRFQNSNSVWIDPRELAEIKSIVSPKGLTHAQGK
jgi:hypothetical protein